MGHRRSERVRHGHRWLRDVSTRWHQSRSHTDDCVDWFLWGIDHVLVGTRSSSHTPARAPLGLRGCASYHYPTALRRNVRSWNVTRPLTPLPVAGYSPTLRIALCVRVHVGPPTPQVCNPGSTRLLEVSRELGVRRRSEPSIDLGKC